MTWHCLGLRSGLQAAMADNNELFGSSTSQLSFERFINTINQEQAKDLVRSINL